MPKPLSPSFYKHATAPVVVAIFLVSLGASASAQQATLPMAAMDYFVGAWTCSGVFPASGRPIASTMRFARDLQGAALVKHHDDVAPGRYHALEAWAYDSMAKRFNATILDNFGGARRFSSEGWNDSQMIWDSAPDTRPAQRFVYVRADERKYRVDWEVSLDDGTFKIGDTLACVRP